MKKILPTLALSLASASVLFAGGIENKTNMSTGYLRNPSRNAESSRPEAAFYNIAGTGFLTDGLYLEAGNQFIFKEYSNKIATSLLYKAGIIEGEKYNDETTVVLYPDFDFVYKHDKLAFLGTFGVYAGGGELEYSEGTSATAALFSGGALQAQTKAKAAIASGNAADALKYGAAAKALLTAATNHSLTVTSITYGGQLGLAYQVNDQLSLAIAERLTYGTQKMKISSPAFTATGDGSDHISYFADAFALNTVFGIHMRPTDKLDVGMQFSTKSSLKYHVDKVKGNTIVAAGFDITDKTTWHTDLAPTFNLGAAYKFTDKLSVSSSFNYYFNKFAKMDSVLSECKYKNSFEIALGADYDLSEFLTLSAGTAYGHQGVKDDANNTFNPVLDSVQFAAGLELRPVKDLTLTAGATYVDYFTSDYYLNDTYKTKLNKNLFMCSLGATLRLAK